MCNNLELLAKFDEYRFIAICEHGTVHIGWDHFTLYLRPEEFVSLDVSLSQSFFSSARQLETVENPFEDEPICFVSIFDIMLRLNEASYLVLTDLVHRSVQKLPVRLPRVAHEKISVSEWPPYRTIQFGTQSRLN